MGKRTFATNLLEERLGESDFLAVEPGVDGAREAREFCLASPSLGSRRAVLVDDADLVSDGAQDAYLKLCEEPPAGALVVLVLEDEGLLSPALLSRVQKVVRWRRLPSDEFEACLRQMEVPTVPASLCDGRPGLAKTIAEGAFGALRDAVASVARGAWDPLAAPIPEALDGLKGERSPARTAASVAIRAGALAVLDRPGASSAFLRLASTLLKVPSANAGLHWFRACLAARAVR